MNIDIKLLACWLRDRDTNNQDSNAILDGLEELYGLETELAKEFDDVETLFDMSHTEFKRELAKRTSPGEVFANAENIYDFLTAIFGEDARDSVYREWTFQWYADETGKEYDEIYNKWLGK